MYYIVPEWCVECEVCVYECPVSGIYYDGDTYVVDECIDCSACIEVCPVEAILPFTAYDYSISYSSSVSPSSTITIDNYGLLVQDDSGNIICDGSSNMLRILSIETISVTFTDGWGQIINTTINHTEVESEPLGIVLEKDFFMGEITFSYNQSSGVYNQTVVQCASKGYNTTTDCKVIIYGYK